MASSQNSTVTLRRPSSEIRPFALARFARKLQEATGGKPFDCLISGDAELQRLNREFRGKDYPTDVLSFPRAASPAARASRTTQLDPLGDIAISLARARAQARQHGHSTETEVRILMLHGALHLAGYDHETDSGRMARAEKRWRNRLGLPGGLIERTHA
jgi:probable rRNA maturation factor